MVLNNTYSENYEIEDVIQNNLYDLKAALKKEKVNIEIEDFNYDFFTRQESLGILSDYIYPEENLPVNFGVYRGYNGGGMHGTLLKTEIDRMTKRRQNKAIRLLNLFEKYFWQILRDVDSIDELNTGEEKPFWETLTL